MNVPPLLLLNTNYLRTFIYCYNKYFYLSVKIVATLINNNVSPVIQKWKTHINDKLNTIELREHNKMFKHQQQHKQLQPYNYLVNKCLTQTAKLLLSREIAVDKRIRNLLNLDTQKFRF